MELLYNDLNCYIKQIYTIEGHFKFEHEDRYLLHLFADYLVYLVDLTLLNTLLKSLVQL